MQQPRRIKIMLAEDNEDHAEITIETLMEENVKNEVSHFLNGDEAISFLKSASDDEIPDLILLDIKMPLKTGFDVLEYVKSNDRLKSIPVVMISTTTNAIENKKAYDMGAATFIKKPISYDAFIDAIKSLNLYWTVTAELPPKGNEKL